MISKQTGKTYAILLLLIKSFQTSIAVLAFNIFIHNFSRVIKIMLIRFEVYLLIISCRNLKINKCEKKLYYVI